MGVGVGVGVGVGACGFLCIPLYSRVSWRGGILAYGRPWSAEPGYT